MTDNRRLIGVVGMPGSGKGIVDDLAREMGFLVIVMGDFVREETTRRGMKPTPDNVGRTMLQIRREKGNAVVARRCIEKVIMTRIHHVLIEGIRSLDEVQELRSRFSNLKLLAIHSSPQTRFQRIFKRKRSDDGSSQLNFKERDARELKVGIGSAIALADYVIINEGNLKQFKVKVKRFLKAVKYEKYLNC